mmetsp:Transcript_4571/g.5465  ORF Transcript_4571/g.5465 Transcript_4571/m.5465 type:complete len:261 (-) Transcript_4571:42-824(-)
MAEIKSARLDSSGQSSFAKGNSANTSHLHGNSNRDLRRNRSRDTLFWGGRLACCESLFCFPIKIFLRVPHCCRHVPVVVVQIDLRFHVCKACPVHRDLHLDFLGHSLGSEVDYVFVIDRDSKSAAETKLFPEEVIVTTEHSLGCLVAEAYANKRVLWHYHMLDEIWGNYFSLNCCLSSCTTALFFIRRNEDPFTGADVSLPSKTRGGGWKWLLKLRVVGVLDHFIQWVLVPFHMRCIGHGCCHSSLRFLLRFSCGPDMYV